MTFVGVCNCLKMHRGHFKYSITTAKTTIITKTTKTTTLCSTEAIRPKGFQWLTRYPFWTMTGLDLNDNLSIGSFVCHFYLFIYTTFSSCPFVHLVFLSICSPFFILSSFPSCSSIFTVPLFNLSAFLVCLSCLPFLSVFLVQMFGLPAYPNCPLFYHVPFFKLSLIQLVCLVQFSILFIRLYCLFVFLVCPSCLNAIQFVQFVCPSIILKCLFRTNII